MFGLSRKSFIYKSCIGNLDFKALQFNIFFSIQTLFITESNLVVCVLNAKNIVYFQQTLLLFLANHLYP